MFITLDPKVKIEIDEFVNYDRQKAEELTDLVKSWLICNNTINGMDFMNYISYNHVNIQRHSVELDQAYENGYDEGKRDGLDEARYDDEDD